MSVLCQERVVSSRKWTRIHLYHWTQSGQVDKKLEKWTPLLKTLIENDIFPVWTSVSLIYSSSQLCLSFVKHYTRMTSTKQDVIKKKLIFSKLWPIFRFFSFVNSKNRLKGRFQGLMLYKGSYQMWIFLAKKEKQANLIVIYALERKATW